MSTKDKGGITATEVIASPTDELVTDESLDTNELEASNLDAPPISEETPASEELDDSMDLELTGELSEEDSAPLADSVESGMDMGEVADLEMSADAPDSASVEDLADDGAPAAEIDAGNISLSSGDDKTENDIAQESLDDPSEIDAGEGIGPSASDYDAKLREIDEMLASGEPTPGPQDADDSTSPNLDQAVGQLEKENNENLFEEAPSDPSLALSDELESVGGLDEDFEVSSDLEDDGSLMELDASTPLEDENNLEVDDDTSLGLGGLEQELSEVGVRPQNTKMFNLSSLKGGPLEEEAVTPIDRSPVQRYSTVSSADLDVLQHKDDQLLQMNSTVNFLRAERAKLLEENTSWEMKVHSLNKKLKELRDQIDEKSIELDIINKRSLLKQEESRKSLMLADEKKSILLEKNKKLEQEIQSLQLRDKIDVNKVHHREHELENMLELLKSDTQAQIQNRDNKIMDLKRKMDLLQFDLKSMSHKEKKAKENASLLQAKLSTLLEQLKMTVEANEHQDEFIEPAMAERRKLTG